MKKHLEKEFLHDLGFIKPNIIPYKKDNFEIKKHNRNNILLIQDNVQWMAFNTENYREVFQVYPHYMLAKGHCICTGMGFLLRENWLLNKKEVTKVTVIEKNKNVIDYHNKFNPQIMEKLEVIHGDVYSYKGKCDTLLVDNFEGGEQYEVAFLQHFKIISDNIKSDVSYMWPLESILSRHYRNYIGLSLSDIYYNIKKYFELKSLPNLSEEELFDFCHKFYLGNFEKCDFSKIYNDNI